MTTPTTSAQQIRDDALRSALSSRTRPPRPNALSASLTFGWRALLKIKARPRAAVRRHRVPDHVHADVHLPVRRRSGRLDRRVPAVPPAWHPGPDRGVHHHVHRDGAEHRHHQRSLRPLPVAADLASRQLSSGPCSATRRATRWHRRWSSCWAFVLGFRPAGGVVGVLLSVALLLVFSFGLSWIWTALGLILRTPNSVMMASFMILFPLTFASNIFVDPRTMPRGWRRSSAPTPSPTW